MIILYSPNFEKHYANIPIKIKQKFSESLNIFSKDQFNPLLKNHALKGRMFGYRSISLTGNYRVIYRYISDDILKLVDVGTHNQVY